MGGLKYNCYIAKSGENCRSYGFKRSRYSFDGQTNALKPKVLDNVKPLLDGVKGKITVICEQFKLSSDVGI